MGIEEQVDVRLVDLRDPEITSLVQEQDVIFNLAGQVSHLDSMRDPHTDLEVNCRSQLSLLEARRHHSRAARIVFAGTGHVLRPSREPPSDRTPPTATGECEWDQQGRGGVLSSVYHDVFGIQACSLRLTNVYGPRQLVMPRG
jgi:UDP-glucose 4-epimerase